MKNLTFVSTLLFVLSFSFLSLADNYPADIEARAQSLESEIISPCCWTQPVSIHPSGVSDRIKTEIRQMLSAGKTEQQILDHYVAIHGTHVLSIPPQQGFNKLSFLMPAILGVLGFIAALYFMKTWSSKNKGEANSTPTPIAQATDIYSQKLKEELNQF